MYRGAAAIHDTSECRRCHDGGVALIAAVFIPALISQFCHMRRHTALRGTRSAYLYGTSEPLHARRNGYVMMARDEIRVLEGQISSLGHA